MKTLTLQEIHAEAKKYDPNSEPLQDAFVAGARFALTGKYYKSSDMFVQKTDSPKQVAVIINDQSTIIEVPTFEQWWNLYAKKRGRKKTETKWNKLSLQDKALCFRATPAYVASTPDVQYRLDPLTYLNGERWNDEIIQRQSYERQHAINLATKAARILGTNHS